eukprot:2810534-Amphidinium_carterae.7
MDSVIVLECQCTHRAFKVQHGRCIQNNQAYYPVTTAQTTVGDYNLAEEQPTQAPMDSPISMAEYSRNSPTESALDLDSCTNPQRFDVLQAPETGVPE